MGRLARSWDLVKQSWNVLKKDKELMLLPILSGLASVIAVATFIVPAYFTGLFERAYLVDPADENAQYTLYAVWFCLYLVLAFITIFFQAALISGATERLAGGDPTIGSSIRGAGRRLGKIFLWSLFSATVSLLIQMLEAALRRGGNDLVGRIVGSILGTAWALATYFVIPVLLFEEHGPFKSLGRSAQLFKQRWGESLVGEWGIGAAMSLITMIGAFALFGIGIYAASNGLGTVGVAFFILGVIWMIALSIIGASLAGIYKAALYRYAKEGQVVPGFKAEAIQGAYHPTYAHPSRI